MKTKFLLFGACSASPYLRSQVFSVVKAMSTLRTWQSEISICICPFAALHQKSINDERKCLVSRMDLL